MIRLLIWSSYLVVTYITIFQLLSFLERDSFSRNVEWPETWPSVSITIPAYNEEDTIGMTIESVLDLEYPKELLEIIVVDDGSQDSTAEEVKKYTDRDQVRLVQQENQGKGAALNTGISEATGKLFACVDADSRLEQDALKNLVSHFDGDTGAVASAMKVHEPQNLVQRIQWLEYLVGIYTREILGHLGAINVTPGPFSIYRRSALEEMGGFDEESLVEDQEVCYRMHRDGWEIGHARNAVVHTVATSDWKAFYHQRKRWYTGSLQELIKYRKMMFNRKYGEFGFFTLPSNLVMPTMSIFTLGLVSFLTLQPLADITEAISQIGLDFFTFDASFQILLQDAYWSLIGTRAVSTAMMVSIFALTASTLYLTSRYTGENALSKGILPGLFYAAMYVFVIGFMYLVASIKLIANYLFDVGTRW